MVVIASFSQFALLCSGCLVVFSLQNSGIITPSSFARVGPGTKRPFASSPNSLAFHRSTRRYVLRCHRAIRRALFFIVSLHAGETFWRASCVAVPQVKNDKATTHRKQGGAPADFKRDWQAYADHDYALYLEANERLDEALEVHPACKGSPASAL